MKLSIQEVEENLKELGYYPTRQIVTQTALNIRKIQNGGQVAQGVHGICLDGPPGAGKSFYAKTYRKLLEKVLGKKIKLISYQCNKSTGKSDLYEEINIAAAITSDADNVILSGKVVQAIEEVNHGEKVILFLDEYDKSRDETDAYLLNFLQDGEIDTTQKGKIKIEEENLQNLQVIICKNDERELSGPLSRRLKSIQLDYMTPEILCRTINKTLKDTNQAIRDTIIMLYSSVYQEEKKGVYAFERIPACSECMQAIKDAEALMDMGADKEDIIVTAIVANMFKNENDIETFKEILKTDNRFVEWYKYLVNALGQNNEEQFERVKLEMARNFYPEQLKIVTKELEEKRVELEEQKKMLEKAKSEYKEQTKKTEQESKKIQKKEEELIKREEETRLLRENAQEDAIKVAEEFLKKETQKMQKKYDKKNAILEKEQEETRILRENAQEDAIKVAEQRIKEERDELSRQLEEKIKTVNEQIQQKNRVVNEKITDYDYIKSKKEHVERILEEKEKDITKQKLLLEKFLGREILPEDFEEEEEEKKIEIDEAKNFTVQSNIEGEIQLQTNGNSNSIFDISSSNNWIQIGQIVLEESESKKQFKFTEVHSEKLGRILTTEKYKKQKTMLCKDGIALYQGSNNKLVAVRVIEQKEDRYQNTYKFYSNTMVTPIQAFIMIVNFVGNLNACGVNIVEKKPIQMELDCLICSDREHVNTPECKFENIDENIYYLKYKNLTEKRPSLIAEFLLGKKGINCSIKNSTQEELENLEKKAFIKHCELETGTKNEKIEKIKEIEL